MIAVRPPLPPAVVVGQGRLGRALARAFGVAGRTPAVIAGRAASAEPELVLAAVRRAGPGTVLLLAVRDDALETLASRLGEAASAAPRDAAALHLSGVAGLELLAPLGARGFSTGSCHPLQSFSGSPDDAGRFEGISFAIDGDGPGRTAADHLARALGGRPIAVAPGSRGLYHLAASLGANGLTGLVAASRDALVASGLDPREALDALSPLLRTALEEALRAGPEAALTGPAARGDEATLERHREALLAWDAGRSELFEALLREQRRLVARGRDGTGC